MTATNNYVTRAERTVMNATNELRKLLDERGVEYETDDTQVDSHGTMYYATYVKRRYGRTWEYVEPPDCDLLVSYAGDLSAEEAIEVTLGRGTCTNDGHYIDGTRFKCSRCDWNGWVRHASDGRDHLLKHCPNCGAKVVD